MRVFHQVPFLTPEAARTAARVKTLAEPVLLTGPAGSGAYHVARSLHREGDPRGFVSVRIPLSDARELEHRLQSAAAAEPHLESLTLYVDRIDLQPAAVQEAILRAVDEGVVWNARVFRTRLVAQTERASGADSLLPALRERLLFIIVLPSLAERRAAIPAIAALLLEDIARRMQRPTPGLTEETRQRLLGWAGTVEELEAALTRALANVEGGPIRPDDLTLPLPASVTAAPPPLRENDAGSASASLPTGRGGSLYRLESVITELAHELKNPMVTIKTFAQHMDHLLTDAELREKFSRLTSEAIERMDGFLDELLQFSRFTTPQRRGVTFGDIVSRSLSQVDPPLREQIRTNGLAPDVRLVADEEQMVFAVRALIRGLSRELPADVPIMLSCAGPSEIVFRAKVTGVTRKLQSLLYHENGSESETSLHFVLADALVQRNGGTCRVVRASDSIEAHLTLPGAEG